MKSTLEIWLRFLALVFRSTMRLENFFSAESNMADSVVDDEFVICSKITTITTAAPFATYD